MSFREDKPNTPVGEGLERVKQRQRQERSEHRQPMNPDRDFSWENTNFKDSDYE